MIIKILAEGGAMKPGPALSQKLGPAGIPINKVIEQVNAATSDMKGLKVPVELDVDPATKAFKVMVFSPPVSELMKKELGIEKGSGAQGKVKVANASIEQIISVAKTKIQNLLSKDLKSAVSTIVGTCGSLGILVENKNPTEVQQEIREGKYDKEISEGKTDTSSEKLKELNDFFEGLKKQQDVRLKQEKAAEDAAAAEKEKKVANKAASEKAAAAKKDEKKK